MAYDETLAGRIEDALASQTGIVKKKMFGVACYMRDGNAFTGVWGNSLIVRTGPSAYESALAESYVREFDITRKPMKGWLVVGPEVVADEDSFQQWLNRAIAFAKMLPKKTLKKRRNPRRKSDRLF